MFGSKKSKKELVEKVDVSPLNLKKLDQLTHMKTNKALRKSKERFKQIAEVAQEWIWEMDANGLYTYTSPAVEKNLGYKPEEITGRKYFYDLFYPQEKQGLTKKAFEVFAKKQSFREIIKVNVHKNGKPVWFLTSGVPILDDKGGLLGYRGVDANITDRKQLEEALCESEGKYRILFENLPQKIFYKDKYLVYVCCNENFARDLKIKPEEIVGKIDYDFFPKQLADKYRTDDKRIMKSGKTESIEDKYILNGHEQIIQAVKTPIKDKQDNTVGLLGIFWDITDRKATEKVLQKAHDELERRVEERTTELAKANEQLQLDMVVRKRIEQCEQEHRAQLTHASRLSTIGEMASGLAHELNQPLCAIANYTQASLRMMRSGAWASNELLDAMEETAAQTIRAGDIIRRIGKLVRKHEPQRTTVDINNIIREVISFVEAEARLKGITILQVETSKEIPTFLADPIEIEQVLLNLLFNALEAISDIPDGRREITIRVAIEKDDSVQVTVSDTGKGLPPEIIDKVFDPFFTTKPKGLGIGLSISRSIIKAHGGQLWAAPGSPNGATFGFTLPLKGVCYDSI